MGNSIRRKISKENFYFSFSTIHLSAGSRETRRRIKERNGWATLCGGKVSKGRQNFFFQTLNWNSTISKAFHDRFQDPSSCRFLAKLSARDQR